MTGSAAVPDAPIRIEDHGRVRAITFSRSDKLNAFDSTLYHATAEALVAAAEDEAVHVVVLTGEGRAFSAGQDLAEMAALATGTAPEGAETGFTSLLDVLVGYPKPLVAAVNGLAIGIGFTILPHCDLVLVDEGARLRVPFAELGAPPEAASSLLFPARMGWQRAAYVLLTSDWITADQAVEFGLALRTCAPGTVLDEALALAHRVASAPLSALLAIKRLMQDGQVDAIVAARRREEEAFATPLFGDDVRGALDSFNERPR